MSNKAKQWNISKTFVGTVDTPVIAVQAGCAVKILGVVVNVAWASGTLDIKDGTLAALGSNTLMATAAVAPTVAGMKGNTATGLTAIAAAPAGFLFVASGAIWIDSGTLVGATGSITVVAQITRVFP